MVRQETAGDPVRLERALAGLRRYQNARRDPDIHVYRRIAGKKGAAALLHIPAPNSKKTMPPLPPVVLVPSIVNSHDILDLAGEHSLARYIARRGHATYLVDWGSPEHELAPLSIGDLIATRLLPLLDTLKAPPILIGYCLGGTMAIAAAVLRPVHALVTLAAPWHFRSYPPDFLEATANLWRQGQPTLDQWGMMPMEILQQGFWSLDRATTVGKFERYADYPETSAEARLFTLVEDWANGGAPLSRPAATEMFETFFAQDAPGAGQWRVGDRRIDPEAISCPVLHILSRTDRIVPHATGPRFGKRRTIGRGHVGMIIGTRARSALWQPLARWLAHPA